MDWKSQDVIEVSLKPNRLNNYDRRKCGFTARNWAGDWMLIER